MKKQLPKNWVETSISDFSEIVKTKGDEGIIPYLEIGNINIVNKSYELKGKPSVKGCKISQQNDILISKVRPTRGATTIVKDHKLYVSSAFTILRFKQLITSRLVFYQLAYDKNFSNYLGDNCTGTMYPTVSENIIREFNIKIPPLPEQQRIVDKLDTLFSQLENLKTSLDNIPLLLKNFRQQVLTQAVAGKLTEEWRKGKKLKVWENVELNKVIPKGGIFDGPFGSNLKTEDYTDRGVRVIRLENIEHLDFIENKETYVSDEKHQKLLRHTVCEGDIIFSSFISEDIRACILPKLKTKAIAKADCFCIRPDITIIDKKFLLYILVSNTTYSQLTSHIHGATRPRINTTQLKTITIPLVSLREQQEIVSRVESLFAKANAIEQQYKVLKASIDTLPQALLHKAFKGELSEQLDSDSDARDLLKQIQELKKSTVKPKKAATKKVKNYPENKEVLGMVAEGK